jgi:heavy metal translocating P-type ATPase
LSGEQISSGVLNAGTPFFFTATATSEKSTYAAIISLVRQAQNKSAPGIRIAQQWSIRFLPVALTTAALAWIVSGDVHRAVAVLVVATPCPLILAVPIAIVAGLSRAAHHGAIIKGGGILELLGKAKVVLLDKTGTLTHGGPVVSAIYADADYSPDEVLRLAASVDQFSPHIVAKALIAQAQRNEMQLEPALNIHEEAGHHISGDIGTHRIRVGQISGELPSWVDHLHPLMVAVERDGKLIGAIGLDDPVREEASEMVSNLRKSGVTHIALVSGDRPKTANEVAASVGITEVYSQISAEGKLRIVRDFQSKNLGAVIVVGDGVNDAPALAAADVGVAMGARGASAASEAADVVIVEDSIDRLTSAIKISQMSRKKALQSAFIGMALSIAAMGCAAAGAISPSQGALLQELIDVTAIVWALTALRARL